MGVWWKRGWLLKGVQQFLDDCALHPGGGSGGSDNHFSNLFRACRKWGISNPQVITQEELTDEFFICKQNIDHLIKNGP